MNMLYTTLKITIIRPSEQFLVCHCSFQTDLNIRIYPILQRDSGWFDWFGRGFIFVWGVTAGASVGGPVGAAIGGAVMDKFFGQHWGPGGSKYVARDRMVTITAREVLQSIPNKGINDGSKKLYTFVPHLQGKIDFPE